MLLARIPKFSVLYSHAPSCQKAAVGCRMLLASSAAEKSPTDLSLLPHNSDLPLCHGGTCCSKSVVLMSTRSCLYFISCRQTCLRGQCSEMKPQICKALCQHSLIWKTAAFQKLPSLLTCSYPMGPRGPPWKFGKHKRLLLHRDLLCQVSAQIIYFLTAGLYSPETLSS